MAKPMTIYRLEDLSVNYFVKDYFAPYTFIKVVDEFPESILQVPTVSVVNGKLSEAEFELGNSDRVRTRRWLIDIFAANKSQRDDFAYDLLTEFKKGITVYDYNEGFPPSASPTAINHLSMIKVFYEPIDVIPKVNEKLYFRGQIILVTENDKV